MGCICVCVGGLGAEGKRAMCQLSIKKLKAMEEKATSLAPGALGLNLLLLSMGELGDALVWM